MKNSFIRNLLMCTVVTGALIIAKNALASGTTTNVARSGSTVTVIAGHTINVRLVKKALKTVKNNCRKPVVKSANTNIAKVQQSKAQKKRYGFSVIGIKKGKTSVTVKYKKKCVRIKINVKRNNKISNIATVHSSVSPSIIPIATIQPAATQASVVTNAPAQPTNIPTVSPRPLRTRIEAQESKAETVNGCIKLTDMTTYSPDGRFMVNIWSDDKGKYYYNVVCDGVTVVELSSLGIKLTNTDLSTGLTCDNKGSAVDEIYETYDTITLAASTAENHCCERTANFSNTDGAGFDLLVRVYDDGIAYRYTDVTDGNDGGLTCTDETSSIIFPENTTTWGGYGGINTYEFDYSEMTNKSFLGRSGQFDTPFLANVGNYWILVSEAQIYNNNALFCKSILKKTSSSNVLNWDFGDARDETIPLEQQAKQDNTTLDLVNVNQKDIDRVETDNGFSTPWRAMIISDDYNKFCTSTLISNLNPSPKDTKYADLYADTSWIKPGKVLWSWWSDGNSQGNYNMHKNYIDMASEYEFDYVCLDVGWRGFEDRLGELCSYASEKNVGVFCWVNYWELTTIDDIDALFSKWSKAGAVGLKTDYFEGEDQKVLEVMENIATVAAKYHMVVLYHGCISPGGEYRTYPNVLTTEAVLGEENRKWSTSPSSKNCLMYPFTRNVLGAMDYTPACCEIKTTNGETEGFALAKSVVYESGLIHFAAPAADYRDYAGLSFMQSIYPTWDESFIPQNEARPGEYVTYVRRHGDEWFIGSMTLESRTMTVNLDFLKEGKTYNACIYSSGDDGKIKTENIQVTSADELSLEIKKLDGVAVTIR